MQDVPEEDGLVYIKNDKEYKTEDILNHFVNCKIENVSNYDLIRNIGDGTLGTRNIGDVGNLFYNFVEKCRIFFII